MCNLKLKTLSICFVSLLLGLGCSPDSQETELTTTSVNENDNIELSAKTSGGKCSSAVNFKNLNVETSWLSGKTGDRDEFGACGVDGEKWMDKYNDGRVMLRCLSGDSHRTELKESSGNESNLKKYKRMKFTSKFTSLPKHGVTIAQIHNRGKNVKRPWIRLYIDDDRRFKIKETETNPTGSSSSYSTYTGMKYTSNTNVTITVWTGISGKEEAKIRVDYNGNRFEKTLKTSSSWNNVDDDFYLKAGVYTEGNDKQARVTYSKFEIKY